jgi:dolichol-phosphate mannosyltransferase
LTVTPQIGGLLFLNGAQVNSGRGLLDELNAAGGKLKLEDVDLGKSRSVIAFASYREAENLHILLSELAQSLNEQDLVVIADDSGVDYRLKLEASCQDALKDSSARLCFSYADAKSGRGAAIRRVFNFVFDNSDVAAIFLEADSDGSHRPDDILKVLNWTSKSNVVIGSRYSKGSRITGWPIGRRVFSKVLNFAIPKILNVSSTDLTNGLRRYDREAIAILLSQPQVNSGFIYLSEVAYLLSQRKLSIQDLPIHFENRLHGESTVGITEILNSLRGLWGLVLLRAKDLARL